MQLKSHSLFGKILSPTIIFSLSRSARSASLQRKRSHLARVTSTHPRLPVLPPSAPPAPCTAHILGRSTRSRGSPIKPTPTSASSPTATPTPPRRIPSAPTHPVPLPNSTTSHPTITTLRPRLQAAQHADPAPTATTSPP